LNSTTQLEAQSHQSLPTLIQSNVTTTALKEVQRERKTGKRVGKVVREADFDKTGSVCRRFVTRQKRGRGKKLGKPTASKGGELPCNKRSAKKKEPIASKSWHLVVKEWKMGKKLTRPA